MRIRKRKKNLDRRPNPAAVETLLALSQSIFADERERGKNLDSKTASFAAFSGTILALDVTLGERILRRDAGCVGDVVLPVCFVIAAIALVVAAGVAVVGVLRPQPYLGLKPDELKAFANYPRLASNETEIRARMLSTIGYDLLPPERSLNNNKAKLTKVSAFALAIGLLGIAAQAITIALHDLGV